MASPASPSANLLPNSTTKILTSTYVPLSDATSDPNSGYAVPKAQFIGGLKLQPGETDAVRSAIATGNSANNAAPSDSLWPLVRQYEGTPLASQLPPTSAFANVPVSDLTAFGNGLVAVRQQAVQRLQQTTPTASAATNTAGQPTDSTQSVGAATDSLNTALVQVRSLGTNTSTSHLGMLNLERLEMTPAGIERGGLIATIPLAPKERTFVVQKEWSVTTQEFTSIVTDSLDNFSETGVTENTQLTQATTSQIAHNNQSNVTASASGGVNFVIASGSASGSTSFTTQDQNSTSANTSRQNAVQTTRQASSRVKQSHKTTISTTTVAGTSEATTRKLENPSTTDAMRIDYFSMMRKWYVALYRYGLRLTYDITVPEPGAALRETYAQLAELQSQSAQLFTSPIDPSQVNAANVSALQALGDKYGVQIPPVPSGAVQYTPTQTANTPSDPSANYVVATSSVTFSVADGQEVSLIEFNYNVGQNHHFWMINIVGYVQPPNPLFTPPAQFFGQDTTEYQEFQESNIPLTGFMIGATGSVTITCQFQYANPAIVSFNVYTVPTAASIQTWESTVYSALYNAAQSTFYSQQQAINAQITALQNKIENVDTLTLRREENDEIMKCALRWLLGPTINFAFMPASVQLLFSLGAIEDNPLLAFQNLSYGVDFTGDQTSLGNGPGNGWSILSGQEDQINFINQAIEWENVVFFTYSYFWDYPECWDFIRQIQHNDKTRQAFLRAGSARIILTVRQGWEELWVNFVHTGKAKLPPLGSPGSPSSPPYLTIAQQIQAYDSTNYPGIPAANPNGGGLIDDDTPQVGTTCASTIHPGGAHGVVIPVADVTGFVIGATAIIDNWDAQINPATGIGIQETQTITTVTATSTPSSGPVPGTITVQGLQYSHTGSTAAPFPVVQAGAKGVLIGEWFEYTPTSGTDIQVTINPTGPYA